MDLFRKEAIDHQRQRLFGEVTLANPMSAWVITALIGVLVMGIIVALVYGSYARKETVSGWLTPDKGLVRISATQFGIVKEVHVEQGDFIEEGAAVVTLTQDRGLARGGGAIAALLLELKRDEDEINTLISLTDKRYDSDHQSLSDQEKSLTKELAQLESQQTVQKKRLNEAEKRLAIFESLYEDDASSYIETQQQREAHLVQQQARDELTQRILIMKREIGSTSSRLRALQIERQSQLSELRSRLSSMRARRTELESQGTVVLRSPISGRVAALPVNIGQSVSANAVQAMVLPEGGRLEAELFVPTRAVGFIQKGQEARLQFDAFPAQKFGQTLGEIVSISKTIFNPSDLPIAIGIQEPVYRISVNLENEEIEAYGDIFPLQAGMTLRANIIQEKRKLWEVLLDPLLSAGN